MRKTIITENKKGGDTTDTETSKKYKSKKGSESSLDKDDPKKYENNIMDITEEIREEETICGKL